MEYLSVGQLMEKHGISLEEARKMRIYPTMPQDEKKEREVTLGQVDALIVTLGRLGGINDHYNLSLGRSKMYDMTKKQYNYLNYLVNEKHLFKINSVLDTLKIDKK